MRPSALRIHRRKAVSGVSLPGSRNSSPSADDPKRSISFLHSRRSAKCNFCAIEISEAVVGDLNLPAICCPWRLHLNFSCQVESNGWFSAIKLIARISGPGHLLPLVFSANRPLGRLKHSVTYRRADKHNSAFAGIGSRCEIGQQSDAYLPLTVVTRITAPLSERNFSPTIPFGAPSRIRAPGGGSLRRSVECGLGLPGSGGGSSLRPGRC